MTRRRWIYAVGLTAVVVILVFWLFPPRWWLNTIKPVDLSDPEATGAALIAEYECRRCHLVGGLGKIKGPNLAGVTVRVDAVSLRLWLRDPGTVKGSTPMPNFHLSDSEIEAIVAYLRMSDEEGE